MTALSTDQVPTLAEVQAERGRRSLYYYLEKSWGHVDPAPFRPNWHLEAVCEVLEAAANREIKRLLINIPPRTGKSTTVDVAFPTWEWIDRPETKFLCTSYAERLAIRDAVKSRRLMRSRWWQERWGGSWVFAGDQNEKSRYENDLGGYRLAAGVRGSNTGEGGDIIIVDDPHNREQIESDAYREEVLEWWDQTMSTRLNDPETGVLVVIMQRLHEKDLSGHVLEQGGYHHLCLPMEYSPKHPHRAKVDPRRKRGELLHPDRFTQPVVADLRRRLGARGAAGQLDQLPAPAEGLIFKRDAWRFWRAGDSVKCDSCEGRGSVGQGDEILVCPACHGLGDVGFWPKVDELAQSWDMSFKDTDGTDFVVGAVWGKRGARKYLLDLTRGRMDFPTTVTEVLAVTRKWPAARLKLVEEKANGAAVISVLKKNVPGLVAVNPKESKKARAHAVTHTIEAGDVYLPHPSLFDWVDEFVEEHAKFDAGEHDDQVDTTTQMLSRWESRVTQIGLADVKVWE